MNAVNLPSSFRDPSGFLFSYQGSVYRQINQSYRTHYDNLMMSGLYQSLIDKNWLIPHKEVTDPRETDSRENSFEGQEFYKVIYPDQIGYISYPYEWCFEQLKDAAILTLNIQFEAMRFGMVLKDASGYNIQFHRGKPVFIDTLSFENHVEGEPWIAYRQFCQHFLAPLALVARCDFRLLHLLRSYIDGIPLDLTSQLLPARSWFKYSILVHIHLHAKTQNQFKDTGRNHKKVQRQVSVSKTRLVGLVSSLLSAVNGLKRKSSDTEWGNYYTDTNYVDDSMQHKQLVVSDLLAKCGSDIGSIAADFGANTGRFSRLAVNAGYNVLSYDIDEVAVEKNYRQARADGEQSLLPLILDITNPVPGIGWANNERTSFIDRQQVEVGLALALIHHIAISNNVPLAAIAELFSHMCNYLIIEFVPKSDSQVQRLLATRKDIFPEYNEIGFECAFKLYFDQVEKVTIRDTERTLYLFQSKPDVN